ncbi:hypothetical protein FISHEDRAFT_66570 [Fistulina hepatica ATCC 64428]|uniref:Uncharacterized protein n=1 Tax=Fistulina hepatica ATCC 64428 TaxID=1128425 RepID=A0A0D7A844_9AGAR|nr:hypothetical protein FISHEDRAFT_66570 [Fistulina hepatica ATCC 64428]
MTPWHNMHVPGTWRQQWRWSRRQLFAVLLAVIVLSLFVHPSARSIGRNYYDNDLALDPPSWDSIRLYEDTLPQHNLELPFPEGRNGRYVMFSEQVFGLGWNNVLNELLMNAHLAYASGRAYVFHDYGWNPDHYPWPRHQWRGDHPWTPIPALLAGPTAGGPWEPGDPAPRSVSSEFFDVVCPRDQRRIINTADAKEPVRSANGLEIFEHWRRLLHDAPEPCIEIMPAPLDVDWVPQTFDLWLWGSDRILSLWEEFSRSPTSRLLAPSPIAAAAVDRNEYLFLPKGPRVPHGSRDPYARLLAIHLRRGDYESHCRHFAKYSSTFYSWNLLPFLPDKFLLPAVLAAEESEERTQYYLRRCLPDFDEILKKIRQSRDEYLAADGNNRETLDVLYLATNDDGEWLAKLTMALRRDGWYTIVTSKDLELDAEQLDVNMAVDMEILRKAVVFIGNGWSSFTSNIVHRRLVDGRAPITIRFY